MRVRRGGFADLKRDCCPRRKRQNRGGSTRSFSTSGGRAARLGIPEPEDDPEPVHRPGMSIGDTIRAGVQRMRERHAAEEVRALL